MTLPQKHPATDSLLLTVHLDHKMSTVSGTFLDDIYGWLMSHRFAILETVQIDGIASGIGRISNRLNQMSILLEVDLSICNLMCMEMSMKASRNCTKSSCAIQEWQSLFYFFR